MSRGILPSASRCASGIFAASVISRVWAVNFADTRGAKQARPVPLRPGCSTYLLSLAFTRTPEVSVSLPLLGRAVLGGAETFTICEQLSTKPQRAD